MEEVTRVAVPQPLVPGLDLGGAAIGPLEGQVVALARPPPGRKLAATAFPKQDARHMASEGLLSAWEWHSDVDIGVAALVALDRLVPPDLDVRLLSSTGDHLSVEVVRGAAPVPADALWYVETRGAFEVVRREDGPDGRVVLSLAARLPR